MRNSSNNNIDLQIHSGTTSKTHSRQNSSVSQNSSVCNRSDIVVSEKSSTMMMKPEPITLVPDNSVRKKNNYLVTCILFVS